MTDRPAPKAPPTPEEVGDAVRACYDSLCRSSELDWSSVDAADARALIDALRDIAQRLPTAVGEPLLREVIDRDLAPEHGYPSTASYLVHRLGLDPAEAAARIQAAERSRPAPTARGDIEPR